MTVLQSKTHEIITIARTDVKRNNAVVYQTRTEGQSYVTTLIDGRATGCSCGHNAKGHKFCKHMDYYEGLEAMRATEMPVKKDISQAPLHHNQGFSLLKVDPIKKGN